MATCNQNAPESPILNLLDDVLVAEVFAWLGPVGTFRCSLTCKALKRVAYSSRFLWRDFTIRSFSVPQLDASTHASTDWRMVYAYLAEKAQQRAILQSARVVFSDDGSAVPGYPPENAISIEPMAWCTNAGVDENVDLVIELPELTLLSGFAAKNGGTGYTAPLKEALVFCSAYRIDLDNARKYNGEQGSTCVEGLKRKDEIGATRNNHRAARDLPALRIESLDPEKAVVSPTPRCPTEPVVAFRFHELPTAYHERLERRCPPTIARYVHFKLLSSHKTTWMLSSNIDVMDLHSFGVPLPELPALLQEASLRHPDPDPSYRRQHDIREYPYLSVNFVAPFAPV